MSVSNNCTAARVKKAMPVTQDAWRFDIEISIGSEEVIGDCLLNGQEMDTVSHFETE